MGTEGFGSSVECRDESVIRDNNMKERRKKKRTVREKDWAQKGDTAFTHDRKRHRRTNTALTVESPRREAPENFEANGLVIQHTKKYAFVKQGGSIRLCRISPNLTERDATLLAPGDEALVEEIEGEPWVVAVKPRRTKLSRLAIEHSRVNEQVIAANVDNIIIVASALKPALKPGVIDRYLIVAQVGGVRPILCVNKMDLVDAAPEAIEPYRALEVPIILASAETGRGIDDLRAEIANATSVFAGQSGVGKSTLLNRLAPGLDLETQEVSEATEKGKHTTTSAHLYELPNGIRVIDTPGIRQLGIWEVTEQQLVFYFPEIAELAAQCKFRNCSHTHEPDCAVRDAVEAGELPPQRFWSYQLIKEEVEERDRKY